ncbi:MAG: complex I subunit 5 family protein [Candidatus Margulisbacteria bacterium]|jgi:formate hydrogenlyase subunit 3/multisubunit Na+/H+ antiporter MnhD subunit|nr:complex I subunit 5 family protein [Candidatus Margulisiibacteriota bacterium]
MPLLAYIIIVPLIAAGLGLIFRRAAGALALAAAFFALVAGCLLMGGRQAWPAFSLLAYSLNSGAYLIAALITLLTVIYSLKYLTQLKRLGEYYAYLLLALAATAGALFTNEFLFLFLFWGLMGLALYLLIGTGGERAPAAAQKTLIILGGSDLLMALGAGLVWSLTGSMEFGGTALPVNTPLTLAAFLLLLTGAFAKAGVMPLHSWIPAAAEGAPTPVMALLPAALDKLVGVYLIARISLDIFMIQPGSLASLILLALGSFTIMAGVLGALLQHDLKKLLSFHAVSQVGYMVVGIGTGLPVGLAGALFHLFNNAIYKSALFFCAGSIEHRTGTTELKKLGGLAGKMPLTFAAALIAALAISGVPPLNGFVSKWLIYQGLIEVGQFDRFWLVWLTAAMLGSAFTLASFVKLLHAAFLGQWSENTAKAREVSWPMWFPPLFLAGLCVVFGLFAYQLPLRYFILPVFIRLVVPGVWDPGLATIMLFGGLLLGLLLYLLGNVRQTVTRPAFYGGEELPEETIKVTGDDFYDTVKRLAPLGLIFRVAERKVFDLYEQLKLALDSLADLASRIEGAIWRSF